MGRRRFLDNHPFPTLLYLEWILLGIALVTVLSALITTSVRPFRQPLYRPFHDPPAVISPGPAGFPPDRSAPALEPHSQDLNAQAFRSRELRARRRRRRRGPLLGALASIGTLGAMGLYLPRSRSQQVLCTAAGLGLSWLAILLGGRGASLFPALLLVVVIRSCVLFPWRGRLLVTAIAYSSFILMMIVGFLDIRPLGLSVGRPLPRALQFLPREVTQNVFWGLTLNSALLFGLVLAFVLLLVGALLAEKDSRQQLVLAHRRLRDYALLIEDQATLQERNRIAREIHDSLGHSLTAQSIQLENVAMFLTNNALGQAQQHLQQARQLGATALREVRQSVAALRTQPWQGRSLTTALSELAQEFEHNTQIPLQTRLEVLNEPSAEVNTALYRVVQEGLTNVAKYSQATQVQLTVQQTSTQIQLRLEDNGQGFDPTANSTGFGLRGMRERIEALGGRFQVISQVAQGCQIQVEIPVIASG